MAFRCEYRRGKLLAFGGASLALGGFLVSIGHGKAFIVGCACLLGAPAFFLFAMMLKNAVEATSQKLVVRTMWGREHIIPWHLISRIEHKDQVVGFGAYRSRSVTVEIDYLSPDGTYDTATINPNFIKLPGGIEGLLTRLEDMINGRASGDLPGRSAEPFQPAAAPQPAMPGPRRATFGKRVA